MMLLLWGSWTGGWTGGIDGRIEWLDRQSRREHDRKDGLGNVRLEDLKSPHITKN
jgi:hypothetical protein